MKSDAELIEKTLSGEWRTYAVLVGKYESKIYNYVLYMLRNREDAEEVSQDTFMKAYRALHTFRGEAKFSTWLLKIARFECLTRLRRKSPNNVSLDELEIENFIDADPAKPLNQSDKRTILRVALSKLNNDERSVITLFYFNELSIQETVDATEFSESNVKIHLHRGRKKLLRILNEMGVKESTL